MRTGAAEFGSGPSLVYPNGVKVWLRSGLVHRDGGPAVITVDGTEHHYQRGRRHRRHGPAIESSEGGTWFLFGHRCDPLAEPSRQPDGTLAWPDGRPALYDPDLLG